MLKELSRQLAMNGRNVEELRHLSDNLIAESSTWRLLKFIISVKEESENSFMGEDISGNIFSEKMTRDEIRRQDSDIRHIGKGLPISCGPQVGVIVLIFCKFSLKNSNPTHAWKFFEIFFFKTQLRMWAFRKYVWKINCSTFPLFLLISKI